MKIMKKHKGLVILFIVISLLVLSACGKSEQSGLESIKEKGKIVIATSGDNPPTIFPNEKNELVGIDADWAVIIAKDLGVEIEWKRVDFKGIIPGITSGNFDIGMSGILVTEERKKAIDFSEPYANDEAVVIFPEEVTNIKSPKDIKDKIVGVVTGSSNGEAPVKEIGGYKELKQYPGVAQALADLQNERVDVVVTGKVAAGHWLKSEGKGYKMSEEGIAGTGMAAVISKENKDLTEAINKAILKAKEEGKYEEIAEKWLDTTFSE